ncbi:hypothetical protein [Plantactinospora sp. WMMB782]|uniref:hypothetical protein n=1 Tax=Plantactinospora sp. WMMB782 TaxID=3404121 RepID=UPI003B9296C0
MPAPRRSRTGLVLTVVLLGGLLVLCAAPAAFFGIRYATFETGPHDSLPNVCTALSGERFRSLIGPGSSYERRRSDAGWPSEGCHWAPDKTRTGVQVAVDATRYTRSFWSGSTDKARERFERASAREHEFAEQPEPPAG